MGRIETVEKGGRFLLLCRVCNTVRLYGVVHLDLHEIRSPPKPENKILLSTVTKGTIWFPVGGPQTLGRY